MRLASIYLLLVLLAVASLASATAPSINFVSPTPASGTTQNTTSVYVNVSSSDSSDHYVVLDWNNSLVFWMRFENQSGESATYFMDESSWSNNGTCSAATCPALNSSGKFGKAMQFNRSNCISLPTGSTTSLNVIGDVSIFAWVKTTQTGASYLVLDGDSTTGLYGYGWGLDIGGGGPVSGKMSYLSGIGGWKQDTGATINDGNWHYVGFTQSGTTVTFYKDGVQNSQLTGIGQTASWSGARTIGNSNNCGATTGFNGTMDDIQIYNRALTPAEINASYNASAYQFQNFEIIPL